jgi:hypothetical protein
MIILTAKQIGLLCALYDETTGDLSDFMDTTDLSFERIDDILRAYP